MSKIPFLITKQGIIVSDGSRVVSDTVDWASYQYIKATNDMGEIVFIAAEKGLTAKDAYDMYKAPDFKEKAKMAGSITAGTLVDLCKMRTWLRHATGIRVAERHGVLGK